MFLGTSSVCLFCKLFDRVLQLTKVEKCYMQFTEFHLNLIIDNCSKPFGNIRILFDSLTLPYKIYFSEHVINVRKMRFCGWWAKYFYGSLSLNVLWWSIVYLTGRFHSCDLTCYFTAYSPSISNYKTVNIPSVNTFC